jgi:TPR repeat protein
MKSTSLPAFVLCAALLSFCSLSVAATLQIALAAKDRGDFESAFQQFMQLASSGDAAAQFQLSILYDTGKGTRQDANEAFHWLRMSAVHGNIQAQSNLGVAFSKGRGVAQDLVRAYTWFAASADSGDSVAATNRDVVARRMTEQQITQAKALLIECQRGAYKACL